MQAQYISREATNHKKTETKIRGRRTVESTAVYSMPRMDWVCSDLPSLFNNQNLFRMQTQKDESNLSILRERWAVAELEVSYKPTKKTGVKITGPDDAYQVFRQMWDNSLINIQEQFCCLFLNVVCEVIAFRTITTGKSTSTTIDFNFIITCSLLCRAHQIIIAHNHPSGSLKPSENDKNVTVAIKSKLNPFEIEVADHLIITDNNYYSFLENGIILKN